MLIKLIGDNVETTDDMKRIVYEKLQVKLEKLLKDFEEDIKQADLSISQIKDKGLYKLKFDMWLPGKKHIFADVEDKRFEVAVTALREKLEHQLRDYVGKLQDRSS
jgi:ribosomal subunit interface protein